ncbi:hypothetical protein C0J52_05505 [Blattella germanica]|nr:hypothetical protein C0J52_05505 [Blattella germanica]
MNRERSKDVNSTRNGFCSLDFVSSRTRSFVSEPVPPQQKQQKKKQQLPAPEQSQAPEQSGSRKGPQKQPSPAPQQPQAPEQSAWQNVGAGRGRGFGAPEQPQQPTQPAGFGRGRGAEAPQGRPSAPPPGFAQVPPGKPSEPEGAAARPAVVQQIPAVVQQRPAVPVQKTLTKSTGALQIPSRKGVGTLGRKITLDTNHLALDLTRLRNRYVEHYDVSLTPDTPKRMLRFKSIISRWLLHDTVSVSEEDSRPKEFKVSIQHVAQIDMDDLRTYSVQGRSFSPPQVAIQALDVVLRAATTFRSVRVSLQPACVCNLDGEDILVVCLSIGPGSLGFESTHGDILSNVEAAVGKVFIFQADGREITVQQYFRETKKVNLKFPHMPCLWVGSRDRPNKILLPPEIKRAGYNQSPYVKEFGISVSENFERIGGRVLDAPSLEYKSRMQPATVRPMRGVWNAKEFYASSALKKWIILCLNDRTQEDELINFSRLMQTTGKELGMVIDNPRAPKRMYPPGRDTREIEEFLRTMEKENVQLVLVVISDNPRFKDCYSKVKQTAELNVGVLTQCLKARTMQRMNPATPECLKKPVMIVGADVTHPSPDQTEIPSVAAVMNQELTALRKACSRLNIKPLITFLVVQKRHHTRFFPTRPEDEDGKNRNVPPGTIVDTEITHPTELDFYLGVSRPTKYHLLWNDDDNMTTDEIEKLTYYLCHLFSRCTRSVSYPAPTYNAHLAAFRARAYLEGKRVSIHNLAREQEKLAIKQEIISGHPMFYV